MVTFFRKSLNNNKLVCNELQKLLGVGFMRAHLICGLLGLNPKLKVENLSRQNVDSIKHLLDFRFYTGPDLVKINNLDLKRLISLNCYRGLRHRRKLPVRGQRTNTNAKTARKSKRYVEEN
uniref:Ribosomal protein S13 n=1 Tax=Pyramimonas parkeae TaxID=36894 RepID=A0A1D8I1V8_9CHLO|nr:ribosomal protein S13 [Pyramimonas parkeae]AOT98959.1 ribosomal protein S13 [Pyramimonas parkeae]